MERLIDENELIKGRVENDPVVIAAKCAPTAYDPDKVVEQLEKEFKKYYGENWNKAPYLVKAIEIVRGGGVDGN